MSNKEKDIRIYDFAGHCSNCNDEIIRSFHILVPFLDDLKDQKGYLALCQVCAHDWLHKYLCPAEPSKPEDTDDDEEGQEI